MQNMNALVCKVYNYNFNEAEDCVHEKPKT